MAVPASLADLSTTPASNPPAGSDAVFPLLDDYMRTVFAFIATLRDGSSAVLSAVSGADTITASLTGVASYRAGQVFSFTPAGSNATAAVTINVNSLGAKSVYRDGVALPIGALSASIPVVVLYDGTRFNVIAPASTPVIPSRYTTGELVSSFATTAPAGTVAMDGLTIGNASSEATSRANADTLALFTLLWNQASNALLPIQDSAGIPASRGASAASDFAANRRLTLPTLVDGQAILAAVSSGVIGSTVGAVISHGHGLTINGVGDHAHYGDNFRHGADGAGTSQFNSSDGNVSSSGGSPVTRPAGAHSHTGTANNTGGTQNLAAGVFAKIYLAL
jgi:hypothetical protein